MHAKANVATRQATDEPNSHLARAERALAAYVSGQNRPPNERERELLASLRLSLSKLEGGE